MVLAVLASCGDPEPQAAGAAAGGAAAMGEDGAAGDLAHLGAGFVVWESNRGGAWRLWMRRFDGAEERRLSPEERGRSHCCPHISPDGRWVAYLSHRGGERRYAEEGTHGELRLLDPANGAARALGPARTYFENRAAVWRSPTELIHIDGEGFTVLRDLASGEVERLTADARERHGWLIDPTLRWAVDGSAAYSPYDRRRRTVMSRPPLGGCQPTFSADGRWGIWMAGAGGPIGRIDLATGERRVLLRKGDGLLPAGIGYLYFPMPSRDGMLLAFAASAGEHDHFRADYDVFVMATDPRTLEPLARPVRASRHGASDRFPDVYAAPLPLGRQFGEAPFLARFTAPQPGAWEWSFGDGGRARGQVATHAFERGGAWPVTARLGERRLAGRVVVSPARAPRLLEALPAAAGAEIHLRFDEEVALAEPSFRLASGAAVRSHALAADGRGVVLRLAAPLVAADRLELAGIADRAQRPNLLPPATVEIPPPHWPTRREGLAFLWQTGDAANLVPAENVPTLPVAGGAAASPAIERAAVLTATGRAVLDHDFAMALAGGSFAADGEFAAAVPRAAQAGNELTVEMVVAAAGPAPPGGLAPIVSSAGRLLNFRLGQRGDRLLFALRSTPRGPAAGQEVPLVALPPGRRSHVAITYTPGRLVAYLDGVEVLSTGEVTGDFFHFRSQPLTFGAGAEGGQAWRGTLEGVAIYGRVLDAAEVAENYRRYAAALARRAPAPHWRVEAVRTAATPAPSLAEISPYREALAVHRYRVERVLAGPAGPGRPAGEIRVAHWVILDGAEQHAARAAAGERATLALEPFAANRQLESRFLADSSGGPEGPLYHEPLLAPPGEG